MTCETCRHWKPVTEHRDGVLRTIRGECSSEAFERGYGDPDDMPEDSILIENDEGWGCLTGPKFGCVHWKERDAPST